MNRIGKKILMSYFVLVSFTVILLGTMSIFIFKSYLKEETLSQLKYQGNYLEERLDLERDNLEFVVPEINREILAQKDLGGTKIIISDLKSNIMYKNFIEEQIEENDKEYIKVEIIAHSKDQSGREIGKINLFRKVKGLKVVEKFMLKSIFLGFLVSLFFSMAVAFIMGKNITKPIKELIRKIEGYSPGKFEWNNSNRKDEIGDIDRAFGMMNTRVKDYHNSQIEFFQNTSHEFKTPIMSIQGYSEAIRDKILDEEDIPNGIGIIISESQRLKELVDELLYLGRIETKMEQLNMAIIDMDELGSVTKERFIYELNERDLKFNIKIESGVEIFGDSRKMEKILANLMSNSIRYAKKEIFLNVIKSENKDWLIEFWDDSGLLKEIDKKRIFEKFYKGKNGLTGLGLPIVKALCELQGMDIYLQELKNDFGMKFVIKNRKS